MNGNVFHSGAQNAAERCQHRRCDTSNDTGKEHCQKKNHQDDAECHQLATHRRKCQTVKLTERLICTFLCGHNPIQQRINISHLFFGRVHGLPYNDILLRQSRLYGFVKRTVVLLTNGRHRNYRDPQFSGQFIRVDGNALSLCHVHHVEYQNRRNVRSDKICQHIETAPKLRGIRHHKHQIGISGGDIIPGDNFFI